MSVESPESSNKRSRSINLFVQSRIQRDSPYSRSVRVDTNFVVQLYFRIRVFRAYFALFASPIIAKKHLLYSQHREASVDAHQVAAMDLSKQVLAPFFRENSFYNCASMTSRIWLAAVSPVRVELLRHRNRILSAPCSRACFTPAKWFPRMNESQKCETRQQITVL